MTFTASGVTASYRRGQHVVTDVSLSVAPGEFALILGHNGAGKTTLLNALYGTRPLDAGSVRIDGELLASGTRSRIQRGIAFVPSEGAVIPGLTVHENLVVAATAVPGRRRRQWQPLIAEALGWFPDLEAKLDARARTLSGGQRRMLAIAMALTQSPSYLLMDEPSLGLAPQIVDDVFFKLAELRSTLGMATIVVEQTARPTLLAADQIHVIRGGEQAFQGDREAFDRHDLWELL
ncbi:ABC transporter ATP-binding protein [Microbacterium sp. RD1]|uniref:ABC transporter ATP-binding protein n=1 Tax=Microbacterium sp. RD1 TaxID=3457313 RepID=UPI003FA58D1F